MSGKIFINYRRDDSAPYAVSVAQYLENAFGKEKVFIDVDRLRPGERFIEVLNERLYDCAVMLVIIGPSWLESDQRAGKRRIDCPDDWVRLEISTALARNIHVIPLLVGGAQFPGVAELPAQLRPLADRHYFTLTTGGFRYEMAGLANDIKPMVSTLGGKRATAGRIMSIALRLSIIAAFVGAAYGYLETHLKAIERSQAARHLNEGWDCANKYSDAELMAHRVDDFVFDISKVGCSSTRFLAHLHEVRDVSNRRVVEADYWFWFDRWAGLGLGALAFVTINVIAFLAIALMRLANWVAR